VRELTDGVANLEVLSSSPFLVIYITNDGPSRWVPNLVHSCVWNFKSCHHHQQENHSFLCECHGYNLCTVIRNHLFPFPEVWEIDPLLLCSLWDLYIYPFSLGRWRMEKLILVGSFFIIIIISFDEKPLF